MGSGWLSGFWFGLEGGCRTVFVPDGLADGDRGLLVGVLEDHDLCEFYAETGRHTSAL